MSGGDIMKNTVLILIETHPLPGKSDDEAITQTVKAWLAKELKK